MTPLKPLAALPTHDVVNMPPHLGDQNLWRADAALREGVELDAARGASAALDAAADALRDELADPRDLEARARGITEGIAIALQRALWSNYRERPKD